MGLVCFRLVGGPEEKPEQIDDLNKKLLTNINASGKLHMVPANVMDRFVIRFCVVQQHATREDIGTFFLNKIYNKRNIQNKLIFSSLVIVTKFLQCLFDFDV